MPLHEHQQLCIFQTEHSRRGGGGARKENFYDVDSFIVREPRGETPEYSSSSRYKRMELSGDGHESKTRLISNPVEGGGGAALRDESSLQTNILTITVYIFFSCILLLVARTDRGGREGGERGCQVEVNEHLIMRPRVASTEVGAQLIKCPASFTSQIQNDGRIFRG